MSEEEKTVSASRLGKEAKIGVVVIVGLLLVFVSVVAMRLFGGSGDGEALAANTPPAETAAPADEANVASPTVLQANVDSELPPQPIDHGTDRWRDVSSYNDEPKQLEGDDPQQLPPPPLPSTPSNSPSSDPMAGFALTPPPSNPMRQDQGEASGYGSLSAPPPLPPYREPANSAPSHPDRSYDDAPARSTPAAPISRYGEPSSGYTPPDDSYTPPASPRYGDSDYRQQSPPPSRNNDGFSRRNRAKSFDGPPPLDKDGKYEIQPLDSFWTISEKFFGTGAYFKALEEHNRDKIDDEGRLAPGDLIVVPTVEQLEKSYPDLCPKPERRETLRKRARNVGTNRNLHRGRTYKVNEGDTLFDIARYELGKAARWVEIYELNRDVLGKDFNYLTPGTVLVLPDNGRPDVLAEPPDKGYRR